jgi:hypothetical protein
LRLLGLGVVYSGLQVLVEDWPRRLPGLLPVPSRCTAAKERWQGEKFELAQRHEECEQVHLERFQSHSEKTPSMAEPGEVTTAHC